MHLSFVVAGSIIFCSAALAFAVAPPIGPLCGAAKYEWSLVTDAAPFSPRDGAALMSFKDNLFLLGGWNAYRDPTTHSEVWRSSNGEAWERLPDAPWEGRHTFGSVVHGGRLWVVGGDANRGRYQKGVWSTSDGVEWVREATAPWAEQGRVLFQTYSHDGYIWVLGGQTLDEFVDEVHEREPTYYSDVWRSRDGREWELVSNYNQWAPRGMTVNPVVYESRMQIIGGGTYETGPNSRMFFRDRWSSSDGVQWTREQELAPWKARQYHVTAVFDERMWVIGGYDGVREHSDTWFSCGGSWYEVPTPWPERHAADAIEHRGDLYMVGGPLNETAVWRLSRN